MNPTPTPAKVFVVLAGTVLALVAMSSVLDSMTTPARVRRRGRSLHW